MDAPQPKGPAYATERAVSDAQVLGMIFGQAGWRSIFLAITDNLDPYGVKAAPAHATARYLGYTRTHERWGVTLSGRAFDVLYSPDSARIDGVIDGRGSHTQN